MDRILRRLERRIASGMANPGDEQRLLSMTCAAYGHEWTEDWDANLKDINRTVGAKGFFFYCARCDPEKHRRIYNTDELKHLNL